MHLFSVKFQPIAADDVASFVAESFVAFPINNTLEIAGPERSSIYEMVARYLQIIKDPRQVISTGKSEYYGGAVSDTALVPAGEAKLGAITFQKWLSAQSQKA